MGGKDGEDMESRVRAVENAVTAIQSDAPHFAKNEDLKNMENSLVKWQLGILAVAIISLVTVIFRLTG